MRRLCSNHRASEILVCSTLSASSLSLGHDASPSPMPEKMRESSAPRPSSPPSSCRKFPSCLRANLTVSRLRQRGEYRATMSPPKESENRVAERAQGLEIEQKNRHLTGRLGASEALFARASGGKADAMTGDISARRGALPIKNQRRLTTLK